MPARQPQSTSRSYFLKHLWRTLRRGSDTVDFPNGDAVISPTYQGVVIVDMSLCRGCGLCVRACPADALQLLGNRQEGWRMRVYHDRCAVCGICELACPTGAVRRYPQFLAGHERREELMDEYAEPPQ